jgi:pimeloyl-ACP methyl ester carboxylesterase
MESIRSRSLEANGLSFALDEAGEGDAVALCLHGFPESRRAWRVQLPALARLGWRAVAPDLRGYGGTSRPKGRAAYGLEHLVADADALFEALGARRRLLIGHDWGGIIAWAAAIKPAVSLDGLVIMNAPHPGAYLDLIARSPAQLARSWYAAFFQLPWLPEAATTGAGALAVRRAFARGGAIAPEAIDHYAEAALAPGAMSAMINYYRANAASLGRWRGDPSAPIAAPTLVIWGERDPYLALELAAASAARAADASLARLPGVGHFVQQEAPEAVNERLEAWLRAKGLAGP